jgi:hypothetical protein
MLVVFAGSLALPDQRKRVKVKEVASPKFYLFDPGVTSGSEVDFIWSRGARAVGMEVKAAAVWRGEYSAPLKSLIVAGALQAGHGVYTGSVELQDGPVRVLPLYRFLGALATGTAKGRRTVNAVP